MKRIILLSIAFLFSLNLSARQSLTVMTYNVENLFDWTHDEGKGDYTYLPLAEKRKSKVVRNFCRKINNPRYRKECNQLDWTPTVVRAKIAALGAMIRAASQVGPDIIVLNEVENVNVVNMLIQWELADLGYQTLQLIEGPDKRGIDVAVISKYPMAKASVMHTVALPGKNPRPTRGILEVHLNINNKDVAIFANHWPSPANPAKNRAAAGRTLYSAVANAGTPYVIAAGDFNTISTERNSGLQMILNPENDFHFLDALTYAPVYSDNAVKGTHWFKGEWDYLDRILVMNKGIKSKQNLTMDYVRIVSPSFSLRKTGKGGFKPNRFDPRSKTGISDHLPLLMQFSL